MPPPSNPQCHKFLYCINPVCPGWPPLFRWPPIIQTSITTYVVPFFLCPIEAGTVLRQALGITKPSRNLKRKRKTEKKKKIPKIFLKTFFKPIKTKIIVLKRILKKLSKTPKNHYKSKNLSSTRSPPRFRIHGGSLSVTHTGKDTRISMCLLLDNI